MKRLPLILRLVLAILLGFVLGTLLGPLGRQGVVLAEVPIRLLTTFNGLFGNFLAFIVPLMILAFVSVGIGELGNGAGKMVGLAVLLAYGSTTIAAFFAFGVASQVLPVMLGGAVNLQAVGSLSEFSLSPYFEIAMPSLFSSMSALILAFILGIGMAALGKESTIFQGLHNFQGIIEKVINKIIIPLLPIHIAGIFAGMAYGGKAFGIMQMMLMVFALIIVMHWLILMVQYFIAGIVNKVNPVKLMKNMLPAYFAAIGTQSSTATMPVTHAQMRKNGVSEEIANFTVPLFATIHMPGSVITVTTCAIAVSSIMGHPIGFSSMIGFILMLGVMMVASPGVPGGSIMAAVGILQSILGFDPIMISLMITLYLAQDSFGTAANVTGDGAVASVLNKISGKQLQPMNG